VLDAPPKGFPPYSDANQYLAVAKHSIFSSAFYTGTRAPSVPLFYKLLGNNELRIIGQVAVSIAAWLGLAFSVRSSIQHRRVALGAFLAILVFSSTIWVIEWDPLVLSESLTLSLTAGLLAVGLALLRRPSAQKVAGLLVIALLWATARDSNAYVLLFALPVPVVWMVRSRKRALPAIILAGVLVASGASIASSNVGHRWKPDLLDVIGHRILPDHGATAFFASRGMPLTPGVRAALTAPGFLDYPAVAQLPGWPQFNVWVNKAGRQTYARYLIRNPDVAIATTWRARADLFSVDPPIEPTIAPLASYHPPGVSDLLPSWLQDFIYPPSGGMVWLYFLILAPIAVWMLVKRYAVLQLSVPLVLLMISVPHAFVIALGDTAEIPRHALVLGTMVRLSFVLMAAFAVDLWLSKPVAGRP
jgi:hypothetical protein